MHSRRGVSLPQIDCAGAKQALVSIYAPFYQREQHTQKFRQDAALVALLKTCAKQKDLYRGSRIHAAIADRGILEENVFVGNTLIDMYAKCGALSMAQEVFDQLPTRSIISWNALMTGFVQHGHGNSALVCFERMQQSGASPDAVTFVCILKACGDIRALEKGSDFHHKLVGKGLLKNNTLLSNAVMDMYAKCGALAKARKVFDELSPKTVVSWTTLIAGYCQHGHGEKALHCFKQMQGEGFSPDAVTLRCILKVCGSIGAGDKGKEIHAEIVREGFAGKDCALGSALVDMYAKCGALKAAREVFDDLPVQNIVAWTALIAGYAQHGYGNEAFNLFKRLQSEGLSPNAVTLLCILKACCCIGTAEKGEYIHAEVVREGLMENDDMFGNALVDMYAKCGVLGRAQQVFDELPERNVISWTALMAGYAQDGKCLSVFSSFNKMLGEDIEPTLVTFLVLLNSCSYLGLVNEGQMYFEKMSSKYGITPRLEHHTCMVDLFGRAGHLDKALSVIRKMPCCDYLSVWFAFLAACQKWGNVKLGRLAFRYLRSLKLNSGKADVCKNNIFVLASMG